MDVIREVTDSDWDNRPREMFVWDDSINEKVERFVVYIGKKKNSAYPVVAVEEATVTTSKYEHAGDMVAVADSVIVTADDISITRKEGRHMTNKELSRLLCEKPDREYKRCNDSDAIVRSFRPYKLDEENEPVPDDVYIREGDSPWFVPSKEA